MPRRIKSSEQPNQDRQIVGEGNAIGDDGSSLVSERDSLYDGSFSNPIEDFLQREISTPWQRTERRPAKDLDALLNGIELMPDDRDVDEVFIKSKARYGRPTLPWGEAVTPGEEESVEYSVEEVITDIKRGDVELIREAANNGLITREQENELLKASGAIDEDDELGRVKTELRSDEEIRLDQTRSLLAKKDLSEGMSKDSVSMFDTGLLAAHKDWQREDHGLLSSGLHYASIPQQALARQAVNILENFDALSTEEAKELLSDVEVSPSDIVDFFWRDPKTPGEKIGRFAVGLAADVILDPINFVFLGGASLASRTAKIGGAAIDLTKISKAERQTYKTLEKIGAVVADSYGNPVAKVSLETKAYNDKVLEIYGRLAAKHPELIHIEDVSNLLVTSPEVQSKIKDIRLKSLESTTGVRRWVDDFASGERGLNIGYRVPFTNLVGETTVFSSGTKKIGQGGQAVYRYLIDPLGNALSQSENVAKLGATLRSYYDSLWTKTGHVYFDEGINRFYGSGKITNDYLKDFQQELLGKLGGLKKTLTPEEFTQVHQAIISDLERVPHPVELEHFSNRYQAKKGFSKEVLDKKISKEKLIKITDLKTGARFAANPTRVKDFLYRAESDVANALLLEKHGLTDIVDRIKLDNFAMVQEMERRGLPMFVLDLFSTQGVNRYLKHAVTQDYVRAINVGNKEAVEMEKAMNFISSAGRSDVVAEGKRRQYRGSILRANESSVKKLGMKIFVDDPIELHVRRIKEMDKLIRTHDLMVDAEKHAIKSSISPGPGWVKFDIDHYSSFIADDVDGVSRELLPFIPQSLQTGNVWLPEPVHDRLLFMVNGFDVGSGASTILNTLNAVHKIYINNALFGTGYLGQNFFSNVLTLTQELGPAAIPSSTKAIRLLTTVFGLAENARNSMTFKILKPNSTTPIDVPAHELLHWAVQDNILRSGFLNSHSWFDYVENASLSYKNRKSMGFIGTKLSTTPEQTEKIVNQTKTVIDYATGWRFNRQIAQWSDDFPKLAVYIDRLEKGYSRAAAAEAAEKLFYNFNSSGRAQSAIRTMVPFSSFAIKTVEKHVDDIKNGDWTKLGATKNITNAINGLFVEDRDTRDFLNREIPGYFENVMDPVWGPLLPGMKQIAFDLPWAISAVGILSNPNEHPMLTLLKLAQLGDRGEKDFIVDESREFKIARMIDAMIPPPEKHFMAIAEMNGLIDHGGYWLKKYENKIPPEDKLLDPASPAGQRFFNNAEFGEYLYKTLGNNFFFKLLYPEIDESFSDEEQLKMKGTVGNYFASMFRQQAFGLARLTALDKNFFMNDQAIRRELKEAKDLLTANVSNAGILTRPGFADDQKVLKVLEEKYPEAKRVIALTQQRNALRETYMFISSARAANPHKSIEKMIFGIDKMVGPPGDAIPVFDYDVLVEQVGDEMANSLVIQSLIGSGINEEKDVYPQMLFKQDLNQAPLGNPQGQ